MKKDALTKNLEVALKIKQTPGVPWKFFKKLEHSGEWVIVESTAPDQDSLMTWCLRNGFEIALVDEEKTEVDPKNAYVQAFIAGKTVQVLRNVHWVNLESAEEVMNCRFMRLRVVVKVEELLGADSFKRGHMLLNKTRNNLVWVTDASDVGLYLYGQFGPDLSIARWGTEFWAFKDIAGDYDLINESGSLTPLKKTVQKVEMQSV